MYRGRILRMTAAGVIGLYAAHGYGLSRAHAQAQTNPWISTWTASPQSPRGVMPTTFSNRTVRQIVRVSIGGNKIRIRLSNEFGNKPVMIGAASVGLAGRTSDAAPGSLHPITFGGAKSIIIPPGAPALSDPVELAVAPLAELAVSLYLPVATDLSTVHFAALQTAYVSEPGDFTTSSRFPIVDKFANRFFLVGVMVQPSSLARTIVAFGDAITDGAFSTVDANNRWPERRGATVERSRDTARHLEPGYRWQSDPERWIRH